MEGSTEGPPQMPVDAILAEDSVAAGELYATVECSPRFGPSAFQALTSYAGGKPVATLTINSDQLFTKDNAQANIDKAY